MMLTAYAFEKLINPFGQFSFWLQADLQSPEIDFRSSPSFRHSGQGWEGLKVTRSRPRGSIYK